MSAAANKLSSITSNSLVSLADDGRAVITSVDIAEGVGSAHKSVIQLARQSLHDLNEFGGVAFEMRPFETPGGIQTREVAVLNEPQCTLLLTYMRNNEVIRAFKRRLVREFYLQAQNRPKQSIENLSRVDILRMALQAEEENQRCVKKIDDDRPLVEFARQVKASHDAIKIVDAAKLMGIAPRRLYAFMRECGWLTKTNVPTQAKINSGHLRMKLGSWKHPERGLQQSRSALITGKGMIMLKNLWSETQ